MTYTNVDEKCRSCEGEKGVMWMGLGHAQVSSIVHLLRMEQKVWIKWSRKCGENIHG